MIRITATALTLVTICTLAAHSQTTSKDEMVKKIFTTFKNKDEKAFVHLFPDAATMKSFFFGMAEKDTSIRAEEKEEMKTFMNSMTDSSLQVEYLKDFNRFLRKGEKHGVEWSRADLVSYTADSAISNDDDLKVPMLKGKIYFNVDKKEFFLAFSEVIWLEQKGWYGVNIEKIDEKINEAKAGTPDFDDDDDMSGVMADSVARVVDSMATDRPPKAPPKPKTKQPAKAQPKTKTQTPAKKPE